MQETKDEREIPEFGGKIPEDGNIEQSRFGRSGIRQMSSINIQMQLGISRNSEHQLEAASHRLWAHSPLQPGVAEQPKLGTDIGLGGRTEVISLRIKFSTTQY